MWIPSPGLSKWVTEKVGVDYMANVGGALHGHPSGTLEGAMRQVLIMILVIIYQQAINKWGLKK